MTDKLYLIVNEDGSASTSDELTDEILECAEAGVVGIYDVSRTPIKAFNGKSEWEVVGKFISAKEEE